MYGKTITTFLIDGSPTWIKTVELSNWIWKAIIIPRAKLKDAKNRAELLQPAIYFLFGIDDETWKKTAYIWEAENVINRIWNHDSKKNFWDTVIVFISKDNNLTKADIKYLEARAIEKAKIVWRYELDNTIEPIPNNLPEFQISTMNEFLDNIDLLISAIGNPIIKSVDIKWDKTDKNLYFLKTKGCIANWYYSEEWFIIKTWSEWPLELQNGVIKSKWFAFRNRPILLDKNIISNQWTKIVFNQDFIFDSPSSAASFIWWASLNWWKSWKNKDGKTLDEIERKSLNS